MPIKDELKTKAQLILELTLSAGRLADLERSRRSVADDRYRTAFHASPDAVSITRVADGVVIDVNPGFGRLAGYTRDEATGKSALALFWADPEERHKLQELLHTEGTVRNFVWRLRRKSGDLRWVESSAEPIEIAGEPCLLAVTKDISELKQAEEALRQHQRMVDKAEELASFGRFRMGRRP